LIFLIVALYIVYHEERLAGIDEDYPRGTVHGGTRQAEQF
jgi:hypothetical protein